MKRQVLKLFNRSVIACSASFGTVMVRECALRACPHVEHVFEEPESGGCPNFSSNAIVG